MVLEAIRYARGSLQLLEQRGLPATAAWVEVPDAAAGHAAIRDMTVRGAPAIAIAAALSLAVELARGGAGAQLADAAAAAAAVAARLDFLATSRPTAVNLFEAVGRLKAAAAAAAAAPGATAPSVAEAVIAAAEAMLAADGAANRAMGAHGAAALLAAAAARGRPAARGGGLCVLTHCNTGALATAAFGTALGVVRALAAQGRLERCFCTETRPYNQGARLTAYELAADGLPATLVVDSAAAALMAAGRVDAVVVGADRVAANGDTANKIGTLSLALAAAAHDVPFFVAAPTTTLDGALPDGAAIPIEERSAEEITHFRGERVAAAGVDVWNPAFDVTPARLLEGIITERGLVPRAAGGAGGAFDVRGWLAAAEVGDSVGAAPATAAAPAPAPLPTAPGYVQLDAAGVRAYVAARPALAARVGPPAGAAAWSVEEVSDGNLNYVFIIKGPAGGICVKQAPPFVRCVGEAWPLAQDRARIEAAALAEHGRLAPGRVPALLTIDGSMCALAMEFLAPPALILRKGLIAGETYPHLAAHLSSLLARTLFGTSLLALPSDTFRALAARFANTDMCRLTEQVIFTDPYYEAQHNRHTSPELDADAAALRADAPAKAAAAALKARFAGGAQALLHGDLHTGSLMVTPEHTWAIDPEFAFVGPIGFDVGKVLANLLLALFASDGLASVEKPRTAQRAWLRETASAVWEGFAAEFVALWDEGVAAEGGAGGGALAPAALFGDAAPGGGAARAAAQRALLAGVWADAVGFAGAAMVRRVVGIAHVEDLEAIEPRAARAACERRALRFGRRLLVEGAHAPGDARALVAAADAARADGAQPYFA
jgi:5-methylthioribose kinase